MRGYEVAQGAGRQAEAARWQVTECEPGGRWAVEGIDGPVRAHVDHSRSRPTDGDGTHVDYRVWFEGHGIGRLIRVMAGRGARTEMPESLALLKQRLEAVGA